MTLAELLQCCSTTGKILERYNNDDAILILDWTVLLVLQQRSWLTSNAVHYLQSSDLQTFIS